MELLLAALCALLPHTPGLSLAFALQVLTKQLIIGVLLPTALLYLMEQSARRAFLTTCSAPPAAPAPLAPSSLKASSLSTPSPSTASSANAGASSTSQSTDSSPAIKALMYRSPVSAPQGLSLKVASRANSAVVVHTSASQLSCCCTGPALLVALEPEHFSFLSYYTLCAPFRDCNDCRGAKGLLRQCITRYV
jgi:hypothetical protein